MHVVALCTYLGIAWLVLAPSALAQPHTLPFTAWTVGDGLSQATVTSIAQDTTGYMWLGTDDGLNRFDGVDFTVFRHAATDSTSLPHSSIEDLLVHPDGTLWIATYGGGIARFDPREDAFRAYVPDTTLPALRVTSLHPAPDDGVWLGTEGAGLFHFDPRTETFTAYRHDPEDPSTLRSNVVRDIVTTSDGALWMGMYGGGLSRLDPATGRISSWDVADLTPWNSHNRVHTLTTDRAGDLWLGTPTGIVHLARPDATPDTVTTRAVFSSGDGLPDGDVQDLLMDRDNRLWATLEGGGLVRYDASGHRFRPVEPRPRDEPSLLSNRLRALFQDASGLLWVSTWGRGVWTQRQTSFRAERADPEQPRATTPPSDVAAFAEGSNGSLWIGTYESGVARFDANTQRYTHFRAETSGLPSTFTRAVAMDTSGTLWVGTRANGAGRFDPATRTFTPVLRARPNKPDLPLGMIVAFHRAADGTLWAASYRSGPCRYRPSTDRFECLVDRWPDLALRSRNTYAVAQINGDLWASGWGSGVDRIDLETGTVTSYRHRRNDPTSLAHNSVSRIQTTRDGTVYVTTYGGGISRFVPATETFERMTTRDGLPSNVVYGLLEDDHGDLWMSTNRGLARLNPDTGDITTFHADDGLQGPEFNGHSLLQMTSGELVFGGINGYNRFDPSALRQRAYAPPVVITDLQVAGTSHAFWTAAHTNEPLRLSYQENFLSVRYAALDYNVPSRTRYAHRLDGVDADWVEAGSRRYAAYTDLEPGTYTLRVRGTNSDGVWSSHEARLPLVIVPPFWKTVWFRLLTGGFLLGGIIGAVRYVSTRRLRREVQRLEAERMVQRERERISRDLHDHVGAQLSNLQAGLELVQLAARAGQPDRARENLNMLNGDVRRTMAQLRETIWALHDRSLSLAELAQQVERFLDRQTRYRDGPTTRCTVTTDDSVSLSPMQALHLLRILQEACANALKHAGADTVEVTLQADADVLLATVCDDGIGLPAGVGASDGYGLHNLTARAEELGGTVTFEENAPTGTCVHVRAPLNRDSLPSTDGEAPAVTSASIK